MIDICPKDNQKIKNGKLNREDKKFIFFLKSSNNKLNKRNKSIKNKHPLMYYLMILIGDTLVKRKKHCREEECNKSQKYSKIGVSMKQKRQNNRRKQNNKNRQNINKGLELLMMKSRCKNNKNNRNNNNKRH